MYWILTTTKASIANQWRGHKIFKKDSEKNSYPYGDTENKFPFFLPSNFYSMRLVALKIFS